MSEKDRREILVCVLAESGRYRAANHALTKHGLAAEPAIFAAMERWGQEVERRTIERCAEAARRKAMTLAGFFTEHGFVLGPNAGSAIVDAIRALQDAPSDDTPPARKAELWSEGNG